MDGTLIKNALVVLENTEEPCDVRIRGEKIVETGRSLPVEDCRILDGTGKILVPGGVDIHTHMCLDTGSAKACDDFYSGTLAAVYGGTTTIVDHPGFGPSGCRLSCQIEKYRELAIGNAVIDYGFHGVIQHTDGSVMHDMASLIESGITSFKIYMTYAYKIDDGDALRILERSGELGALIAVHAENHGVITGLRARYSAEGKTSPYYHALSRPVECEAEAVNRIALIARLAGDAPLYIVHVSSASGLEYIVRARQAGQKRLYAETCPQYLFLDAGLYEEPGDNGLKYVMCPPLRKKSDCEALWKGLGAEIDTVATDHCPFFFETKKKISGGDFTMCPSGAGGVEERMPLLFSEAVARGRLSLRRFVELCSTNPAKLAGIYPKKGVIRPESDADLVLFDPGKKRTLRAEELHSNADYSVYEGKEVAGGIEAVFSRGDIVVRDGVFSGAKGRGRFLTRGRFSL